MTSEIILGNASEQLPKIPSETIDAIITDPPYNTHMKPHPKDKRIKLKNFFDDNFTAEEYNKLVHATTQQFYRILKNNTPAYIFIDWRNLCTWMKHLKRSGFKIKNVIIWAKQNHTMNYQNYAYKYEMIIFAVKGTFRPNNHSKADLIQKTNEDIFRFPTIRSQEHATAKPLPLLKTLIRHSTKPNDWILDAFAGSGQTLLASEQMNRNSIGIEIDPKYVKIITKKIKKFNQQQKLQNFSYC